MILRSAVGLACAVLLITSGLSSATTATPTEPPLQARLTVPSSAVSGSNVRIDVHVVDRRASSLRIDIDFGDSNGQRREDVSECLRAGAERPVDQTFSFTHAYRRAGNWPVTVRVFTGGCEDVGSPPVGAQAQATAAAAVLQVHGAPDVSNGPQQPQMSAGLGPTTVPKAGRPFELLIAGGDNDGVLRSATVTFPDGKRTTYTRTVTSCQDGLLTWPSSSWDFTVTQTFAKRGTYRYAVTTVSTGCDGKHTQKATTRTSVQVD